MQQLQHLSQHQVELAFQLLDHLWEPHLPLLPHSQIPKCLRHLAEEEWQMLNEALAILYEEKENSNVH